MLQVPRIDITAPSNAVELDPNVAALYGEGLEDSSESAYSSDSGAAEGGEEEEEMVGSDGDQMSKGEEWGVSVIGVRYFVF